MTNVRARTHVLFAIFDAKTEAYLPPFFQRTRSAAERLFADTVNGSDNPIASHPEDYTLMELAEWNENTGEITPHIAPYALGNGLTFAKRSGDNGANQRKNV